MNHEESRRRTITSGTTLLKHVIHRKRKCEDEFDSFLLESIMLCEDYRALFKSLANSWCKIKKSGVFSSNFIFL